MVALVTGARGFIGSFLVEALLAQKQTVKCLLRQKKNPSGWLRDLPVTVVPGDITEPDSLPAAVEGVDTVFHLAGVTKAIDKQQFHDVNCTGTQNLLAAIAKVNPEIRRFVFVSSLAAAGPSRNGTPLKEGVAPEPISAYGQSKLAAERVAARFMEQLPITIIRPPAVFGPRDTDVFEIFKTVQRGWSPVLSGGPRFTSIIYVKDLVQGILMAVEKQSAVGQTYFICNDDYYAVSELQDKIAQALGKSPRTLKLPVTAAFLGAVVFEMIGRVIGRPTIFNLDKFRELRARYWICDNARIKHDLGFRPNYDLDQALRKTAEWYRKNGWL